MNVLKKIGLTALAGSLVATSVFAGEMAVTGSAGITFAGQEKISSGNGFTMSDEINFNGSGEMDNGWTVSVAMQLDNNANSSTASSNMDNRSIKIDMSDAGTLSFVGHGGSSALGAVDDLMPHASGNEAWDTISTAEGGSVKLTSISGNAVENMFSYNNSSIEGVSFTATLSPSDGTNIGTTMSYAVAYTGVEGLTVGYAIDENSEAGALQTDFATMYAKYAMGAITVGYTTSEEDSATAADNDEFTAYGISYAVSDDMTISYNEAQYDAATVALDQESTAIGVSYTMGSMSFVGTIVSMDNVGGGATAIDDVSGYELGVSFAF